MEKMNMAKIAKSLKDLAALKPGETVLVKGFTVEVTKEIKSKKHREKAKVPA